jgi:hypothetical protein
MPASIRKKGKASKIALAILGVPQNRSGKSKKSRKSKYEQRLNFEDTQRVR